ncbi:MAG: type I DNA topoisomerase [Chloroflexi bacterium HGW-Chloroflexi-9]|nr:MAG: type I DNA topoisomerase [Chloroflexi bacterium HGW-Chloroflexi-9]
MTTDASTERRPRRSARAAGTGGGRRLVIVESPAKARTIAQFLGPDYVVESSIGHIRDLPSSAAEIPEAYKKQPWARLGVNVAADFEPLYVVPPKKNDQVRKLKALLKDADELFVATDEDREGEAIAWHLLEVLKPRIPVFRMVFHEITRPAIEAALANPRQVDLDLVHAQEARRILDRLFGYEVSPVLWKKVAPRLSAGRVQSVAVKLVVDRERQRMRFHTAGYWDIDATLAARDPSTEAFGAKIADLAGKRVASGRDFDPEAGEIASNADVVLLDEARAQALATSLRSATFVVAEVTERPFTQRPPQPFITSTLQQEAARKLRYTAQRTMQVAQRLYENGYITYMRTDSPSLSTQAETAARRQAADLYGADYVPSAPRRYTAKSRGAQEAHEAIRPAGDIFRTPDGLRSELDPDAFRLYDLIWKRTVASQMKDATGLRTQVRLTADAGAEGEAGFQTSGKVITFPGFLRAYVEGTDDPDAEIEEQERVLPPLTRGQALDARSVEAKGHETQPPARWTEASLIRELEERGIGRPSTYASIIETIQDRGYVWKKGSALIPTFVAFAVVNLLEQHFPDLVDLGFTARMEERLDEIAEGTRESKPWLREFYYGDREGPGDGSLAQAGLHGVIDAGWEAIDARAVSSISLGQDDQGREVAVRVGRYGPYVQIGDSDERASVPADTPPDELTIEDVQHLVHQESLGDRVLGTEPESGQPVYLKTGRFGPYFQVGEDPEKGSKEKPKRASLWPGMEMESASLEDALLSLSFPKVLGVHPEKGEPVTAQDGPSGPYLKCGTDTRSIDGGHAQMATLTLDEAVTILAQPRTFRRGAAGAVAKSVLKELGPHPDSAKPVTVRSGRFGPYVTDGVVNASLPRGRDPLSLEMQDALDLLAAREEKMRAEGKDPHAAKPKTTRPRTTRSPRAKPSPRTRRTA